MNKDFIKATGIRALHTCLQVFIASVGTAKVLGDVDWKYVLSATAMATILSIAKSIVIGLPEVKEK